MIARAFLQAWAAATSLRGIRQLQSPLASLAGRNEATQARGDVVDDYIVPVLLDFPTE